MESATKRFAEVQAAYEVLSDPQERAWYDSHRDALYGHHAGESSGSGSSGQQGRGHGIGVVDVISVLVRLHGPPDYSDSSDDGFFALLRETFSTLAKEEQLAADEEGFTLFDYPSFGHAGDDYEDVVRPFYAAWAGFSTKKSFSWRDVYRYSEAPDRRVRRIMEKDNRRFRDEGIREYNDAVRSLVAFARKRDPRYLPNRQTEAERQRALRDATAAQAARSRAANRVKMEEQRQPDWVKSEASADVEAFEEEEGGDEEVGDDIFECVACAKTFKSERQFEAHEESKKHRKAIQQLRRTMKDDHVSMGLDGDSIKSDVVNVKDTNYSGQGNKGESGGVDDILRNGRHARTSRRPSMQEDEQEEDDREAPELVHRPAIISELNPSDDEYAPRDQVESRVWTGGDDHDVDENVKSTVQPNANLFIHKDEGEPKKIRSTEPDVGKAKQRRAKKAAQQTPSGAVCAQCGEQFPSRTKLFEHIKALDHAQPIEKSVRGRKGRKR